MRKKQKYFFRKISKTRLDNKGFTLIELLTVISVIGMIASIAVTSFTTARIKARDARRVLEFDALQKAVELYYTENSAYPDFGHTATTLTSSWEDDLGTALQGYMNSVPRPLKTLGVSWNYFYTGKNAGVSPTKVQGTDCLLLHDGYYLYTRFEDSGNTLPQNDGGIHQLIYEKIGGKYQILSGICP